MTHGWYRSKDRGGRNLPYDRRQPNACPISDAHHKPWWICPHICPVSRRACPGYVWSSDWRAVGCGRWCLSVSSWSNGSTYSGQPRNPQAHPPTGAKLPCHRSNLRRRLVAFWTKYYYHQCYDRDQCHKCSAVPDNGRRPDASHQPDCHTSDVMMSDDVRYDVT